MIPGNDLLKQIEQENPKLGIFLRNHLIPAIETTAANASVHPVSEIPPPSRPESLSVTTAGELMQVVVNHVAPVQKGVQYITHISTNPQFSGAIILDHGSSRVPPHVSLPTFSASGALHSYYIATVAQYAGSKPSRPTYYGGDTPVPVNMAGTTKMDIQPGTGSGTSSNGGQTLVGIGKSQVRL